MKALQVYHAVLLVGFVLAALTFAVGAILQESFKDAPQAAEDFKPDQRPLDVRVRK